MMELQNEIKSTITEQRKKIEATNNINRGKVNKGTKQNPLKTKLLREGQENHSMCLEKRNKSEKFRDLKFVKR